MSHFFERLASSVTRPSTEPRLRPLVGSIFSPAPPSATPETVAPLESIATESPAFFAQETANSDGFENASPSSSVQSTSRESRPSFEPLEIARARSLVKAPGESPLPESPSQAMRFLLREPSQSASQPAPLFLLEPPELRSQDLPASRPNQGTANGTIRESGANDRVSAAVSSRPGRDTIRADGSLARQRPLLPPAQIDEPNQPRAQAHPSPSRPASSPQKSPKAVSARTAGSSWREPDEIFIHIGRVEVAAAAQSTARPAPAPQRKSINLSEYLRRGNGRAR